MYPIKQDYKTEKKYKVLLMLFSIAFFMIAVKCTGQEDRRIKQGDYWYSLGLETIQNNSDTLLFYSVFYPTAYKFSGVGITIKANERCVGKVALVITYDNGLTDYIGSFTEINCEGNCFFKLENMELQHMKKMNIKSINVVNQLYEKTYQVDMDKFRKDWYASVLKQ